MTRLNDFASLERALASRTNYERTAPPPGGFGLEGMLALCEALGSPQHHPRVVHVAGTTGKGTTSAAIASSLDAAGARVGLYTSPHLVHMRERIRIGGRPASDERWLEAAREVLPTAARVAPHATWFELVTAIAFVAMRAAAVDVVVLEVGLGGRLDATNVAQAAVAVITRIARDHTALLGADERSIAGEKAGILVRDVPVVAGPGHPDAIAVIEARAASLRAPLWLLDREVTAERDTDQRLLLTTPRRAHLVLDTVPHRARDTCFALAAGAVDALEASADVAADVAAGLARLRWPGRFQRIDGEPTWILDGAHDPLSAAALLAELPVEPAPVLLVGAARDKDLAGLLPLLGQRCRAAFACSIPSPRAAEPAELIAHLAPHCPAQSGGLAEAEELARAENRPLLITGSLLLVGDAMRQRGLDANAIW